jgi:imidazole glycerol-phosphate synthase subunit HisF
MKKRRLIPVLLLRNGWLVQSKGFRRHQNLGNATAAVARLSEWASDEMIYLDISRDDQHDLRRDDLGRGNARSFLEIIEDVGKRSFMPITVGGRIRSLADIERRLALGADKTAINTQALADPSFITAAAREFGSQCIVASVDVKVVDGGYEVYSEGGRRATGHSPEAWAVMAEEHGAGEILLNSIDRDGMRKGYDLTLLQQVVEAVNVPVIGCGGVGEWSHLSEALETTGVDAVAVANLLHHVDQSVFLAKKYLYERGCNVRPPELLDAVRP